MRIDLQQIKTNFKGDYCFTHARSAVCPNGRAIITTQPLLLKGSDVFFGMHNIISDDAGKSWGPIVPSKTITRRQWGDGFQQVMCDATPFYHKASKSLLLLGHDAIYKDNKVLPNRPRHILWSVFDDESQDWNPFRTIEMPEANGMYFSAGNGSGQTIEEADGTLLIPFYFTKESGLMCSSVMRCSFENREMNVLEIGNALQSPIPRGLYEPSIVKYGSSYFLALRNDQFGCVAKSTDGLNFSPAVHLVFEDGKEIGNYNTQQHWLTCDGRLFLAYTRRGANNDHVFRHRAPIFIAEFDPERMCLLSETEQIAVPERGARLGNFGCVSFQDGTAWVIASEWMQTLPPDPYNWKICAQYGSDNSIFIAKIFP